jgi:hypothetical protein
MTERRAKTADVLAKVTLRMRLGWHWDNSAGRHGRHRQKRDDQF